MQKVEDTHETPFWLTSSEEEMFGASVQLDAVTVAGTVIGAADATDGPAIGSTAARVKPTIGMTQRVKIRMPTFLLQSGHCSSPRA
jgi:hypothetical protein